MAVGKPGAVNAAIFAAQILAASDASVAERLSALKEKLAQDVVNTSARMKSEFQL
jgi:5-(carboxyamino)imidazole ribonucleotide mutase